MVFSGKIVDEAAEPCVYAHVADNKDFANGVITNDSGEFAHTDFSGSRVFISYQNQVYEYNKPQSGSTIQINTVNSLDEVLIKANKITLFVGFVIAALIWFLSARANRQFSRNN